MKPVLCTPEQLRVLANCCNHDLPTTWSIVFRARDVVASNGRILVSIPLPEDPERLFAIRAAAIEPWIAGFNPVPHEPVLEIDRREDGWLRIVEHPALQSGAALIVPVEPTPATALPGKAFDENLTIPGKTTSVTGFRVDQKYWTRLAELKAAFGGVTWVNESGGGTKNGIGVLHAPGHDKGIVFEFDTPDGAARVVVMPLVYRTRGVRPARAPGEEG